MLLVAVHKSCNPRVYPTDVFGLSIDHGRADVQALHEVRSKLEVGIYIKIANYFVFNSAPNLLGGLVYHMTSLSVRSRVVHGLSLVSCQGTRGRV